MNFLDPRLPDRFWSKCIPEPNTGCWLWLATSTLSGYGQFAWNGRMRYAHRISYSVLVGPIAPGLQIDHRVCRQPSCVNPAHLEPVDAATNVRRSTSAEVTRRRHSKVTHCPRGHAYSPENTRLAASGPNRSLCRSCRTCEYERYWKGRANATAA